MWPCLIVLVCFFIFHYYSRVNFQTQINADGTFQMKNIGNSVLILTDEFNLFENMPSRLEPGCSFTTDFSTTVPDKVEIEYHNIFAQKIQKSMQTT